MCARKRRVPLRFRHRPRFKRLAPARRGNIHVPLALVAVTEGITDLLGPDGLVGTSHVPRAVRVSLNNVRDSSDAVLRDEDLEAIQLQRQQDTDRQKAEWAETHPLAIPNAA